MKQVFFKTVDALEAAAGTAGDARFTDLESGKVGFWTLDAATGGDWFASALFGNAIENGADTGTGDVLTVAKPYMLKNSLQVVQGFGAGNPIATPIINTSDIVRVTAAGHVDTTQYAITYTPDTTNEGSGKEIELKFVVRQGAVDYLNYVNNEAAFADLSDGLYKFPLSGFHANNHKIINLSFTAGSSATNTCNALRTAVQNNGVLNAMIKTSGTSTAVLTARHPGVEFEIIGYNLTDSAAVTAGDFAATQFVPGVGNAWQARVEELKARAQAGNFNRMYFPDSFTNFVTSAASTYDRYEITYKIDGDRAVVKGSQFGTAVIYEVNGQNDVGAVLNNGTADPSTTKTEYIF